jgi:hypothetical protein
MEALSECQFAQDTEIIDKEVKEPRINMGPKDFKFESSVFQYDRNWEQNIKLLLDDTL